MAKQVLRITIDKTKKPPKGRIGRWWYWRVAGVFWPRVKSCFYGGLYKFIRWLTPKNVLKKWDAEWEEEFGGVEVVIKDKEK